MMMVESLCNAWASERRSQAHWAPIKAIRIRSTPRASPTIAAGDRLWNEPRGGTGGGRRRGSLGRCGCVATAIPPARPRREQIGHLQFSIFRGCDEPLGAAQTFTPDDLIEAHTSVTLEP